MVNLSPHQYSSAESYVVARNKIISDLKASCSFDISARWAFKVVTWTEHMYRRPLLPSFLLLACQDDQWLRTCRFLASSLTEGRSFEAGATGTRSSPGKPSRWSEKWLEFVGDWENPNRSKALSKERASQIVANFMVAPRGGQLALEDV